MGVPFFIPSIGQEEIEEVTDVLRSGWLSTGEKCRLFEQEFARSVGAEEALAVNSGTGALHVALASLKIGPEDAVITTPMTFCSSVHVIEQMGARPVLVDVEPETLNIDPEKIEEALESKIANERSIKAVLPVHLYGHPCRMDAITELAQSYGLRIVEDAAHALPARYKNRSVGSIGDLTAFSFYSTKNITTAEGGMLTGARGLIEEARLWSLHGMSREASNRYREAGHWYYEVTRPGFKYNMTEIQAALGLCQLRKLPSFQNRRREIIRRYNEALSRCGELELPVEGPEVEHAWHLYALRLHLERLNLSRNQFIEELKAQGVGASVHFIPVHLHPYYRDKYGYKPEDFPIAYREYQRILSLPLYPRMSDQDVEEVVEAVMKIVKRFRR